MMKTEMFKRLLDRFEKAEQMLPDGGRDNPANGWYYNVVNSLKEVSDLINEPERNEEQVKAAFARLSAGSAELLGQGRDAFPKEMQGIYTAMLALQKPLSCYTEDLAAGKNLDEALADSRWIRGIFNDDRDAVNSEGYVPGQYSHEGKTFKDVLDAYKEDAQRVRESLNRHLRVLSGDEYDPDGMIQEKVALLQDFINAHEDEPRKANLLFLVGDGYKELREHYDPKRINDLSDNGMIMSSDFFGRNMELLVEPTGLDGAVEAMKTLGEDNINLIKSELKKARIRPKKMDVSEEMIERFDKNTLAMQELSKLLDTLRQTAQQSGIDLTDDRALSSTLSALDGITADIRSYLRGDEGAAAPTDERFMQAAQSFERILERYDIFTPDGQLSDFYQGLYSLALSISETTPHIAREMKPLTDKLGNNVRLAYLNLAEQLKSPNVPEQTRRNTEGTLFNLHRDLMVDQDYVNNAVLTRMARDPEFNRRMIAEASNALADFDANIVKRPGYSKSRYFRSEIMETGEKFTPEQLYDRAYTMYLFGRQLERERQKLENVKRNGENAVESLRNPVNPLLLNVLTAKKPDMEQYNSVKAAVAELQGTELFRSIRNSGPQAISAIVKNAEASDSLMSTLTEPKQDLLKGVNETVISALTQTSGTLYAKNSESYRKVSDSLKEIYRKNASLNHATKEDYLKLYQDCRNYSFSHDSKPGTDNGQLRATAVMSLMHTLGARLAKADPELENMYHLDNAINMTRSMSFRDANVKLAETNIRTLIERHKDKLERDGYDALPESTHREMTLYLRTYSLAKGLDQALLDSPGAQLTGKYEDAGVQMAVREKLGKAVSFSDQFLKRMQRDPLSVLGLFEPGLAQPRKEEKNPVIGDGLPRL